MSLGKWIKSTNLNTYFPTWKWKKLNFLCFSVIGVHKIWLICSKILILPYLFSHLKEMLGVETKATRKQEVPQLFVDKRMENIFEVLDSDIGTWWEMTTPWLWHLLSTDALSKDRWFLDSVFPKRVLCCHSEQDNEKSVYSSRCC